MVLAAWETLHQSYTATLLPGQASSRDCTLLSLPACPTDRRSGYSPEYGVLGCFFQAGQVRVHRIEPRKGVSLVHVSDEYSIKINLFSIIYWTKTEGKTLTSAGSVNLNVFPEPDYAVTGRHDGFFPVFGHGYGVPFQDVKAWIGPQGFTVL